jgi:tetratricopeptide (TPR) repeat protein
VPADALNDLADALAQSGRGSESGKPLEESKGLARDLKNDSIQAAILNTQGDVRFYQGDLKSAKDFYQQALRLAGHASNQDALLTSRMNLARVAITEAGSHSAISHSAISHSAMNDLRSLAQQADARGNQYISVACSVLLAEAMITDKDYSHARQELLRALARSEKLGLRLENARIHYLLGTSLRLSGSAREATAQYREARNLLDEIRKEQGAEHIIERYDLKPIYAEVSQFAPQG